VFTALHVLIDRHAEDLEQEIYAIDGISRTATEKYQAQLVAVKKKLEEHGNEVTRTLGSKNHIKILKDQKKLADNLDEVDRSFAAVTPPIKIEYHVEALDQLQTATVKCLAAVRISRSDGKTLVGIPTIKNEWSHYCNLTIFLD
jgi:hypothetical protein